LGVPTHKDLQQLSKRIEDLSKAVNELTGKKADGAKKAAAKPAAE
jgi:hypothetical protein